MKIIMRIYRTHDHDLMLMQYGNNESLGKAIKEAVVAYYTGKKIRFHVWSPDWKEPVSMPLVSTVIFLLNDSDAPGIVDWVKGIKPGFRNCFFKNVFRHYLDDPGISLFRSDGWKPANSGLNDEAEEYRPIKKRRKRKKKVLMGSEWVDSVAEQDKAGKVPAFAEENKPPEIEDTLPIKENAPAGEIMPPPTSNFDEEGYVLREKKNAGASEIKAGKSVEEEFLPEESGVTAEGFEEKSKKTDADPTDDDIEQQAGTEEFDAYDAYFGLGGKGVISSP